MKHRHTLLYIWLVALGSLLFAACQSDSELNGGQTSDQKVSVRLNIGTTGNGTSRATTTSWEDGTAEENMFSWVVVITNSSSNQIVKVIDSSESTQTKNGAGSEFASGITSDAIEDFTLDKGTYNFYSFANIAKTDVAKMAGFNDGTFPTAFTESSTATFDGDYAMAGNNWDVKTNHIPMSNKQTITISDQTTNVDLWVVRMLAKITVRFRNTSGSDVTVKAIGLNSITDNPTADGKNIKILPSPADKTDQQACMPSLATGATSSDFTYSLASSGLTVSKNTLDYSETNDVTFYVNESQTSGGDVYEISLDTDKGLRRYALIADWKTIARNDWHVLPVNLDDYVLALEVEAFTQIGVEPSVEQTGSEVLTYTSYLPEEEFHITPKLTKKSDSATPVAVSSAALTLLSSTGTPADVFYKTSDTDVPGAPKWVTNRIEGKFGVNGEGSSKTVTYRFTVTPTGTDAKSLCYKLNFVHDLSWLKTKASPAKHYSRAAQSAASYKWSTADRRWMKIVPVVVE